MCVLTLTPHSTDDKVLCAWPLSRVQLFATPWTVARQTPSSIEFSRQEFWNGLPFPNPGDHLPPRGQT